MPKRMSLIVYPAPDLAKAKELFQQLLEAEPYVDAPYYAGFRVGDLEIGLDPRGQSQGPIPYWEVEDIHAELKRLVDAGGKVAKEVGDVGGGKLVAQVTDAAGSTIGLMTAGSGRG